MKRRAWLTALVLATVSFAACTRSINYSDPLGPRYADRPEGTAVDTAAVAIDGLHIVTFNIKHAREIDLAIELLSTSPPLREVDLLFLQEMDAPGCERIADTLGMHYVYYPAVIHSSTGHDFGNAILSRWPIEDDAKIILPHLAHLTHSQRIAVAGTVTVDGTAVRLYCVHFATPLGVGPGGRREQAETVVADALDHGGPVIVAGDFNKHSMGKPFEEAGFLWPTRDLGDTVRFFGVDHILMRGLARWDSTSAGIVEENLDVSDHKPVWALLRLVE